MDAAEGLAPRLNRARAAPKAPTVTASTPLSRRKVLSPAPIIAPIGTGRWTGDVAGLRSMTSTRARARWCRMAKVVREIDEARISAAVP